MSKRIVVLGAGIAGRMAKILFPEAVVLEGKGRSDIYTSELGVCISIVPIPELQNDQYVRFITIDNQKPTLELIEKYKRKIAREGGMTYGDYRQFEPEQVVFKQELPKNLDIKFEARVSRIELSRKFLFIGAEKIEYDYLINTIPLMDLVRLSDLFEYFREAASSFFMHRPIYLVRSPAVTSDKVIRENYITDLDTPMYRENYFDGLRNQESLFKIEKAFKIYPGKIYPNSGVNQILDDFSSYNVFCAGRYAQWDNKIHLWNVYAQLKLLRGMI
jgi:hypothetical protein